MAGTVNIERDVEICRQYTAGATLQEIGGNFSISRERVRQILRRNKIFRGDRQVEKTDRNSYLGVNITEANKAALRREAERRGISVSALTDDAIADMLAALPQEEVTNASPVAARSEDL